MQQLPKLPPNLQSLVNPNDPNELPAVYVQNPFPNGIDALINGINKNQNYGNRNLLNLETNTPKQDIITGLQKGLNFGIPEIAQAQKASPYKFAANPEAENDTQNQPEQAIQTGVAQERPALFRGLQDVANGFQENAQNPFQIANLEAQKMANGQNKGVAYHLGEGLGTFGRIMNSPVGKTLLTAGIVGATGGNPTQAMSYGLQAGLGNYNNIQQDRMNRQLLQANGINTNGITGYLNNDMAKAYTDNYNKLNNSWYRTGKLTLDQVDQLRKVGLTDAQIEKLNADTDYIKGAKTDNTKANTELTKSKNATEKEKPALIRNQIATNNKRMQLLAQRVAQGDSSARSEYNSLRTENMRLNIEQKRLINKTLAGGGSIPNSDPLGILGD